MKMLLRSVVLLTCASAVYAQDNTVQIPSVVDYKDVAYIQPNVVSQCTQLGENFSSHIAAGLSAYGINFTKVKTIDTSKGNVMDIKITNAVSSGNAWIGHHKSVSAIVDLYKNGEKVETKTFYRDTMGGMGAGFKGSCTVLERATTTLGKDIAQWYKEKR